MKTPTSTLIEYLSTKAKIMSKTRAPSAYMMREAAERMRDMFDMEQPIPPEGYKLVKGIDIKDRVPERAMVCDAGHWFQSAFCGGELPLMNHSDYYAIPESTPMQDVEAMGQSITDEAKAVVSGDRAADVERSAGSLPQMVQPRTTQDINNMSDTPRYTVGDIVRLKANNMVRGFRVWKVNAVCLGGLGQESNYQLAPLDKTQGGDDTATRDCLVPCWMLETHPGIERV